MDQPEQNLYDLSLKEFVSKDFNCFDQKEAYKNSVIYLESHSEYTFRVYSAKNPGKSSITATEDLQDKVQRILKSTI